MKSQSEAEPDGASVPGGPSAPARPALAEVGARSAGRGLLPSSLWVLLLVLLLTVAASVTVRALVRQQQEARFEREVTAYQQNLRQRLQGYVGVLLAVRASWEAVDAVRSGVQGADSSGGGGTPAGVVSPALSSQQFGRLIAGLELNVRYPGLSSLGYAPLLTAPKRAAFARQLPSIAADPAARFHPTSNLALSAPVTYLAPPTVNRSVLGYDMYSDQTRRQAIKRALDSGQVRATGQVTLVDLSLNDPDRDGMILYLPIRDQGGAARIGGVRFSGLLYAPLRISAVLPPRAVAGAGKSQLDLKIALDGQELRTPGSQGAGDRETGGRQSGVPAAGGFYQVETLNLAGQDWTLEFSAPPGFGGDAAASIPWLVMLAGTLVALLAALATQAQVRARVRAERVSRSLSLSQSRLERSRAEFEAVFRAMQDTAVFTDPGGQVLFANDALQGSFGLRPPELRGSPIADLHADPRLLPRLDALPGPHLVTTPFRRRGGETFYGEMQRSRVVGESGETLGQLEVIRDVSERLQTDRALRESERRYQGVLEGMPQIVFLTDAAGRVSYLNRRWREYVGHQTGAAQTGSTQPEVGPPDWSAEMLRAVHPDDRADFSHRWRDALGSGRDMETEYRLRSASGAYRTFVMRGRPVRDSRGQVQEWVGSSTDIDDQIYAELNSRLLADVGQAVNDRHSNDRFGTVENAIAEDGTVEDSAVRDVQTGAGRTAGVSGQASPQASEKTHVQTPAPTWNGPGPSALAGSLNSVTSDHAIPDEPQPTGLPLPGALHADEGLHRALSLMTARFADSAALWFSSELYAHSEQGAAQPIIAGRARRIGLQEMSQMEQLQEAVAEVMYRQEPSVFHGARLHALGLSAAALYPLMQDDLPLGVLGLGFRQPLQERDLDLGRELAQRLSSALGNRDLLARLHLASASLQDLNNSLEQRVAERTAQLSEANSELEAFSYSVSHDLRTPLRHILGFADLLKRESGEGATPKAARYLKVIGESAERMNRLIDDLLEFSRTSRAELRRGLVDLERLVQSVRADLAPDQGERSVEWRIGPLPAVIGDVGLLRQVFDNLLSNALKYTRTRQTALIEVTARQQGREVWLSVRDNGVGFDPEYIGRLFGVFQRLHRSDEFEGTGIGLANVRRIVARHGGRVWAESGWASSRAAVGNQPAGGQPEAGPAESGSSEQPGATFWVALPLEALSLKKTAGARRALPMSDAPVPGLPVSGLPVSKLPGSQLPAPGLPISGLTVSGLPVAASGQAVSVEAASVQLLQLEKDSAAADLLESALPETAPPETFLDIQPASQFPVSHPPDSHPPGSQPAVGQPEGNEAKP